MATKICSSLFAKGVVYFVIMCHFGGAICVLFGQRVNYGVDYIYSYNVEGLIFTVSGFLLFFGVILKKAIFVQIYQLLSGIYLGIGIIGIGILFINEPDLFTIGWLILILVIACVVQIFIQYWIYRFYEELAKKRTQPKPSASESDVNAVT